MLHLYMTRWERYYINIDLLFWSKLDASFALWNLKTANSLNGSVLIAEHQCGTYLYGGRGSGQMWQMSQAHWLEDKHRQKQLGEISVVVFNMRCLFFSPPPTGLFVQAEKRLQTQWVLFRHNECYMLPTSLTWCNWLPVIGRTSCIFAWNTPIHLQKKNKTKKKTLTYYLSTRFPFTCFKCTSTSERTDWCTSTGDQHCVAQVLFLFSSH